MKNILSSLGLCAILLVLLPSRLASAQGSPYSPPPANPPQADPSTVLVVGNANEPESIALVNYYVKARNIPAGNVLLLNWIPDSSKNNSNTDELCSGAQFTTLIAQPIYAKIATLAHIDYIVMCRNLPFETAVDAGTSIDNVLAKQLSAVPAMNEGGNNYEYAQGPFSSTTYGMYLVTRLDGQYWNDCFALVDRSMNARANNGPVGFNVVGAKYSYGFDMTTPYNDLLAAGMPAVFEANGVWSDFGRAPLGGYASWGNNDSGYNNATNNNIRFAPGALSVMAVSQCGVDLRYNDGMIWWQNQVSKFVTNGLTGGVGYVAEPYLSAIGDPAAIFGYYTRGYNLAEAFYSSFPDAGGWKEVVVGDPLCSPYSNPQPLAASIAANPDNAYVAAGKTATFYCRAAGTPNVTYHWYRNNAALTGSAATTPAYTTGTLTFANDNLSAYTVKVMNGLGSATSGPAYVTIISPVAPIITAQPVDGVVVAGVKASFSVTVQSSVPVAYQWLQNGTPIASATTSSYSIIGTGSNNNTAFSVVATNSAGSITSATAHLLVESSGPQIISNPQNCTGQVGTTVSFAVKATSGSINPYGYIAYQWMKNGVNIASGGGAATYTTPALSATDNGAEFSVKVSNGNGSAVSSTATLTVTQSGGIAPTIISQPSDLIIANGQYVNISALANGSPPLTYNWQLNGKTVSTSNSIAISWGAANAGLYTLTVANASGTATGTFNVSVPNITPTIIAQPQDITVSAGATATFSVYAVVSGSNTYPAGPGYNWQKNGVNIYQPNDSVPRNQSGVDLSAIQAVYTTLPVTLADNGSTFDVVVTEGATSVTSTSVKLTVVPVAPAPILASLSGTGGSTIGGDTITLTGNNFLGSSVFFGGIQATATSMSGTSITCTTPVSPAGTVGVSVVNYDGQSASLPGSFTYFSVAGTVPDITSLSSTSGANTGWNTVVITGSNFLPGATVTFGGVAGTVESVTPTQITVETPIESGSTGAENVVVTNPDGQTVSDPSGYSFKLPAPAVSLLSVTSGTTGGGTPVTISGANFVSGATVTFGGVAATNIVFKTAQSITCNTPPHSAGLVDVSVTNPDAQIGVLPQSFLYYVPLPPPIITTVSPAIGGTNEEVVITGSNFVANSTVTFGGVAATNVVVQNSTTITCTTPPHANGAVAVKVTFPDTQNVTKNNAYTYGAIGANLFTTFVVPNSVSGTFASTSANGIDGNNVVGYYYDYKTSHESGFIYNVTTSSTTMSNYTVLSNTGANTYAEGISGSNVAGYFYSGKTYLGFLYNSGTFQALSGPAGATYCYAYGVSGSSVTGYYLDAAYKYHGFVYTIATQAYTVVDNPQAGNGGTSVYGLSGNTAVGVYTGTDGKNYGFFYDIPSQTFSAFTDPAAPGEAAPAGIYVDGSTGLKNVVGADYSTAHPFYSDGDASYSGFNAYTDSTYLAGCTEMPNVTTATGVTLGTPVTYGSNSYPSYNIVGTDNNGNGTYSGQVGYIQTLVEIPSATAPVITSSTTAAGGNGFPFSYQITATNNPTSFQAYGLPAWAALNPATGMISGTAVTLGTNYVTINASNAAGIGSATLVVTVIPPGPAITSALSASGTITLPFSYQISAVNNPGTYGASGLPPGVVVDGSTGLVSGTPTQTGTFAGTISASNLQGTDIENFSVVIAPLPPAPMITSAIVATGSLGIPFSYQITANGGPTGFGASGLPPGLMVDDSTGLITGTPTTGGTFTSTISAVNIGGTGSTTLTTTVVTPPPPMITSAIVATGSLGIPFGYQITAINNPTSFGASGLPPGLMVDDSTGLITGTPTTGGTFSSTISAINIGGTGSTTLMTTVVTPPPPMITSAITATGSLGIPFSYQITATNSPSNFGASGLPPGLSVDASTGIISGTPAVGGTFAAAISASNLGGTGSNGLMFTVMVNFSGINGSYAGLATVNGTGAGLFTVAVTSKGAFSGKITLANAHYPLKGTFASDGIFNQTVNAGAATLGVVLNINPMVHAVSGTINATTSGTSISYNVAGGLLGVFNKTHPLPVGLAGNYTSIIPVAVSGTGPTIPQATGYASMSVASSGAVHVTGKLGDGTTLNVRGRLQADKKTCTLFSPLYGRKYPGSIAGNITLESMPDSDWDGVLSWIKPNQPGVVYYPAAFSMVLDLMAAKYTVPALPSGSGTFTLGGGNLPSVAINDGVTISPVDKVTVSGTDGVSITMTPVKGMFSGHFLWPGTTKKTTFGGVIYQKPTPAGYGLFLGSDQCGNLQIIP